MLSPYQFSSICSRQRTWDRKPDNLNRQQYCLLPPGHGISFTASWINIHSVATLEKCPNISLNTFNKTPAGFVRPNNLIEQLRHDGQFLGRKKGRLLIYFFARKISIVRSHNVPDTIKFQHCLFVPVRPLVNSQQSVINTSVSCRIHVSTINITTLRNNEQQQQHCLWQLYAIVSRFCRSQYGWLGWARLRTVVLFTRHLPAAAVC